MKKFYNKKIDFDTFKSKTNSILNEFSGNLKENQGKMIEDEKK